MLKIDITQIIRNMKAFKLLVTLLLVALSMGVSSCSEELDNQPMVSYPEGDEPLDIVCKEYGISDYEDIELFWLSGNFWLVSFKISYLCLPLFYETRTTPSCHPSGCAYRQL